MLLAIVVLWKCLKFNLKMHNSYAFIKKSCFADFFLVRLKIRHKLRLEDALLRKIYNNS